MSALDAYVGRKIVEKVIKGALKSKTKVMVTHDLRILHEEGLFDKVILMDEGEICKTEDFATLRLTEEW